VASRARSFSRLNLDVRPALVNGAVGVVATRDGKPFSVMGLTVRGGRIVEMDILADPERLHRLDLTVLGD
jgi:RNA polymerase sigma-70 factor (ECF subfamily)